MLSGHSRQDAEDVLQDVFVRAFGALRRDRRDINVRAWLYRVAHNRCIDHLRRPHPVASEIFEMSRKPLLDPVEEAQRRDDLKRLIADVGRLPAQQRSALLMREIDGLSYADLSGALDVSIPAVKSLLVRARIGLVEAQDARDADCSEIRCDLLGSYDRGVKASGRARKHLRECDGCREYRRALRGVRRSFAALTPAGAGPVALVAKLLGLGGAGGGAAAAGGGGGAVAAGGAATVTACKVAAVVCATAITASGAVEARKLAGEPVRARAHTARTVAPAAGAGPVVQAARAQAAAPRAAERPAIAASPAHEHATRRRHHRYATAVTPTAKAPAAALPGASDEPVAIDKQPQASTGGTSAPAEAPATGDSSQSTGSAAVGDTTTTRPAAQLPAIEVPAEPESAQPDASVPPPAQH
jgi:RNA polymerase sigma factor (sigma-70 family)